MNRNFLYVIIGALVVVTAGLGYQYYKDQQEPSGVHISIGEKGVSITEEK